MSDGEPIRGGFLRGFLVGILLSLFAAIGLSIVFPIDGQSSLAPATAPDVVVDVPTARSALGEETSGVEASTAVEPDVVTPEPAQVTPEPAVEPDQPTEAEPQAVDTTSAETPAVEAIVTAEEAEQPDLEGFSADVTTPTEDVATAPAPRPAVTELQAAELNALLESPDVSVEPMIPLEPSPMTKISRP